MLFRSPDLFPKSFKTTQGDLGQAHVHVPRAENLSLKPGTSAIVGHSACVRGQEIFVWGGGDGKHAHSGLWVVDTVNLLWHRPTTTGAEPMACTLTSGRLSR